MKSLLSSAAFVATVALTAHAYAQSAPAAETPAPPPNAAAGAKAGAQTSADQAEAALAASNGEKPEEKKTEGVAHIHDLTVLLRVGAATTGDRTKDAGPATGGFAGGIDAIYAWKALRFGGSFLRVGGVDNASYGGSLLFGAGIRQDHVILRFLLDGGVHGYSVKLPGTDTRGGGTVAYLGGRLDAAYEFGGEDAKVRPEVGVGLIMQEDLGTKHVAYKTSTYDRFTQTTTTKDESIRLGGSTAAVVVTLGAKFDL